MAVVPFEADGVFSYAFGAGGLGCGLEHGQRAGSEFGRISRSKPCLAPLFVAKSAGAGIAQVGEGVTAEMPVLPVNLHTRARGQVDLHGFGVRFEIGGGHNISIAQGGAWRSELAKLGLIR